MHDRQKNFEDNLKATTLKSKPFNAKINQESLTMATAYKEK